MFCTVSHSEYKKNDYDVLSVFKETEGVTLVLEKQEADKAGLFYNGVWSLITCEVHSDLEAVGFLAAITQRLARAQISVNVVSAYYHDHLFVPKQKTLAALKVLKDLNKEGL